MTAGLGLPFGCVHTKRVDLSYPPVSLVESPAAIREDEAAEPRGAPIGVEPFKDLRDAPSSPGGEHHVVTSGCAGSTHG